MADAVLERLAQLEEAVRRASDSLSRVRAENEQLKNVAILRLEQPYPFPYADMAALLETYPKLGEIIQDPAAGTGEYRLHIRPNRSG